MGGQSAIGPRPPKSPRETGLFLHLGSLAVALPDGRFANRSVLFRPDGTIAATYDKIHLFDATLRACRRIAKAPPMPAATAPWWPMPRA